MSRSLYDPEYWKERAAKARLRAEESIGESAYVSLLQQALNYERLAEAAAQYGPTLPSHPAADAEVAVAGPSINAAKARQRWRLQWLRWRR